MAYHSNIRVMTKEMYKNLLKTGGAEIKPKCDQLVNESTLIVQNSIKAEAPADTHNLQANVLVENVGSASKRVYVDEGNAPYAIFIMRGTKPHIIRPKRGGNSFLVFKDKRDKKGGKMVFAKEVRHPGTKKNVFFSRGANKARPAINALQEKLFEQLNN